MFESRTIKFPLQAETATHHRDMAVIVMIVVMVMAVMFVVVMVGCLAGVMLQTEHHRGVQGAMGHREQCRSGPGLLIQVGLEHIQLRWRQPIGTA